MSKTAELYVVGGHQFTADKLPKGLKPDDKLVVPLQDWLKDQRKKNAAQRRADLDKAAKALAEIPTESRNADAKAVAADVEALKAQVAELTEQLAKATKAPAKTAASKQTASTS